MNALMPYLLNAVFVPALVAGVFALIVAVGPLRRKPALLEAGLASAFCLAFTLSFAREVDAWGLVRNFFAIEGESAPITPTGLAILTRLRSRSSSITPTDLSSMMSIRVARVLRKILRYLPS